MKPSAVLLFLMIWTGIILASETIEVNINGMTCAFCVDAVQRNLLKLPDIAQVEVSLEKHQIRIVSGENAVDIERVKQTILDSGFTPTTVHIVKDA